MNKPQRFETLREAATNLRAHVKGLQGLQPATFSQESHDYQIKIGEQLERELDAALSALKELEK